MSRSSPVSEWQIERAGEVIRLSGVLRTADGTQIRSAFSATSPAQGTTVEIDVADVQQIDSGVVVLLLSELSARQALPRLRNGDRFQPLFELCMQGGPWGRPRTRQRGLVEQLGLRFGHTRAAVTQTLEFIGEMTHGMGRLIRRAARADWRALPMLMERAGVGALPIVLVLNFLVGFVTAFMASHVLEALGANLRVANLVSVSITRQLAPLVTAIVVCGRSGTAYAAELASMRVTEELDALRTLGLEPFSWLVLPRVIALVLVTPVLTVFADVAGMLGGLVVAVTSHRSSMTMYFHRSREALNAWDVESGLWMSVAFAFAIAFIACQQGLAPTVGAASIGRRATQTMVQSLFAIVCLDAAFTVLFSALGRP